MPAIYFYPVDTLSQEDADEEFYIDWNRGKPKMVSRPYDMEQCGIKVWLHCAVVFINRLLSVFVYYNVLFVGF